MNKIRYIQKLLPMLKRQRREKENDLKNIIDMQSISTKLKGFKTDLVMLLGLITIGKDKIKPSYLFKFLLAEPDCTHLVFPNTKANTSKRPKSLIFLNIFVDLKSITFFY